MFRNARAAAWPILCCLAATTGCEKEEEPRAYNMSPDQLYREIEAIRELRPQEQSLRLAALRVGDWSSAEGSALCSFANEDGVLLMADQKRAVARIAGHLMNLQAGGPVDVLGGFYRAGRFTISIGAPRGANPGRHRIAVSLRDEEPWETAGTWSCRRRG